MYPLVCTGMEPVSNAYENLCWKSVAPGHPRGNPIRSAWLAGDRFALAVLSQSDRDPVMLGKPV